MFTFLVAGALGCAAYFAISLFRIVRALGAVARTTETEGIAAAAVSWGRVMVHSLLAGVVVGVIAVLIVKLGRSPQ
jgi:hypothetical protein